jgi:hypothetical protein
VAFALRVDRLAARGYFPAFRPARTFPAPEVVMRPWLLALALALAPLGLPPAAAQGPPLGPPPVWEMPPPPPAAPPPEALPAPPLGQQDPLGLDLLIGLPTAVRFSWAVVRHENRSYSLEGLAGLYVIAPLAGVGGRFSWTPCAGRCNALALRPGVDVWAAEVPFFGFGGGGGVWGVAGDVEIVWFHESGRRCWELGLDLGAAAAHGSRWATLPLVSVVTGCRY